MRGFRRSHIGWAKYPVRAILGVSAPIELWNLSMQVARRSASNSSRNFVIAALMPPGHGQRCSHRATRSPMLSPTPSSIVLTVGTILLDLHRILRRGKLVRKHEAGDGWGDNRVDE